MDNLENKSLSLKLDKLKVELENNNIFLQRGISNDTKTTFAFVVYTIQRFTGNYAINEIIEHVTEGSNDQCMDIFYINEDDECLEANIFQVKYRTENNLKGTIGENDIKLFLQSISDIIIDGNSKNLPVNSYLKEQLDKFSELSKDSSQFSKLKVKLHLITNGARIGQQEIKTLEDFKNEHKNTIGNYEFRNDYDFFLEDLIDENGNIEIPISNNANISTNEEIPAYVVNISAYQLAKLYEKFKERILEKNVRKLLKSKTNKDIEDSLIRNPKLFWHKNNGLSVVCRRAEIKTVSGVKKIILENPYIVNGGQTTKTIYNLFSQKDESKEEDMQPFYDAQVIARIYQTTDEEVINNIVYGTNNQNKITAADLKSLNPNVKKIKQYFYEKNISLLTKRDSEQTVTGESISIEHLLQVYCSIYKGIPHSAKISKTKLIEDEFDGVFSSDSKIENLHTSFLIYQSVDRLIKSCAVSEITRHGLYAVLYSVVKVNPDLKDNFEQRKLEATLKQALSDLVSIISEEKNKDTSFSAHNFFKSNRSKELIDEFYEKKNLVKDAT